MLTDWLLKRRSDKIRKIIDNEDLTPIVTKSRELFTDAPFCFGLKGENIDTAVAEFKHFLFLLWWNTHKKNKMSVVPTKRADILWHGFLIYNQLYNQFCINLYGGIVAHRPGLEEGSEPFHIACSHTKMLHDEVGKYGYVHNYFSHVKTSVNSGRQDSKNDSSCGGAIIYSNDAASSDGCDGGGCGGGCGG
jgi:hypothetical protein